MYESCFANLGEIIIFHLRPFVRLSIENFFFPYWTKTQLCSPRARREVGGIFPLVFKERDKEKQDTELVGTFVLSTAFLVIGDITHKSLVKIFN